jgi:hypothetical protein
MEDLGEIFERERGREKENIMAYVLKFGACGGVVG